MSEQRTGATSLIINKSEHAWDPSGGKDREPTPHKVHNQHVWKSRSHHNTSCFCPSVVEVKNWMIKNKVVFQEIRIIKAEQMVVFYLASVHRDKALWFPLFLNICPGNTGSSPQGQPVNSTTTTMRLISCNDYHHFLCTKFAFSLLRYFQRVNNLIRSPHIFLCSQ